VVIRGDMGAPLGDAYWALAHLVLGGSGMSAPIPSALGPRYTFIYVDHCCGNQVVQHVYPFASSGPVVFTPEGQRSAAFQMSFTDEFPSFAGAGLGRHHQRSQERWSVTGSRDRQRVYRPEVQMVGRKLFCGFSLHCSPLDWRLG